MDMPVGSKSRTLRVARASPCRAAVAARSESIAGIFFPAASVRATRAPQVIITGTSSGKTWSRNRRRRSPVNQLASAVLRREAASVKLCHENLLICGPTGVDKSPPGRCHRLWGPQARLLGAVSIHPAPPGGSACRPRQWVPASPARQGPGGRPSGLGRLRSLAALASGSSGSLPDHQRALLARFNDRHEQSGLRRVGRCLRRQPAGQRCPGPTHAPCPHAHHSRGQLPAANPHKGEGQLPLSCATGSTTKSHFRTRQPDSESGLHQGDHGWLNAGGH